MLKAFLVCVVSMLIETSVIAQQIELIWENLSRNPDLTEEIKRRYPKRITKSIINDSALCLNVYPKFVGVSYLKFRRILEEYYGFSAEMFDSIHKAKSSLINEEIDINNNCYSNLYVFFADVNDSMVLAEIFIVEGKLYEYSDSKIFRNIRIQILQVYSNGTTRTFIETFKKTPRAVRIE